MGYNLVQFLEFLPKKSSLIDTFFDRIRHQKPNDFQSFSWTENTLRRIQLAEEIKQIGVSGSKLET